MILDKLVEKKDLFIYIDVRTENLIIHKKRIHKQLQDSNVANSTKKRLMGGLTKLEGRIKELQFLKHVLSSGLLKVESKRFWKALEDFKNQSSVGKVKKE